MTKPLDGMKVLDFTQMLPGPFGTMILADLGADVIKVENTESPDIMRFLPPIVEGMSALHAHINRGKKSLGINLKKPEAKDIIYRLVEKYDVVIEQFRPGVMEKLSIGYKSLKRINPSLIYCALSGYGQTGPYASRAGHDINYMALSGVDSISGRRETGPVLGGIQVADIGSGAKNIVIGVLAAYIARKETGRGDCIDVSITDGVFAMSLFATAGYLSGGPEPRREDVLSGGMLYDYYATSDGGYLSVGPIEQKFFAEFCEGIGCDDIAQTGIINSAHKGRVASIIASKPLAHWRTVFEKRDACVEPVFSIPEALSNPPLSERDLVVSVKREEGGTIRQIGNPIKFESGHHYAATAGVALGRHNNEILASAGFGEDEIARLKECGAVGPS